MRMIPRGMALLLTCSLLSCSDGAGSDGGSFPPPTQVAGIPCYPDEGPEVFRVRHAGESGEGLTVSVRAATIDRFARILRAKGFDEATAKQQVVDPTIKIAALYSRYADRIPELVKRAATVKAALEAGGDFGKLAAEHSDDPRTRTGGGELGALARSGNSELGFHDAVWKAPVMEVVGPVVTGAGLVLLQVTKETSGASASKDTRAVRQILFAYEAERVKDGTFNSVVLASLGSQIRVDIVDESYKRNLVPESYWRTR